MVNVAAFWLPSVAPPPRVASRMRVSAETPAFFVAASNRLTAALAALLLSFALSSASLGAITVAQYGFLLAFLRK